jgi:tetratricopeptide (TPR) repeat protein
MKRLLIVLLLSAMFALPSAVRADVAPPYNPPGANLQPGSDVTQVRMAAETVLIDVKNDSTPGGLGSAAVTADFTMRNLGVQDESLAVRFPISASDGRDQYPELTGLSVKVNGKAVPTRRVNYPDTRDPNKDLPWAEFQVSFAPGKDVAIEVKYGLKGTGYSPYAAYYYVLETGAGWKGTIGSADIILRLPYPASPQNVVIGTQIGWAMTTPGGVIQGNEMHWHFENFEPGPSGAVDNMEFALVAPSAWQQVLKERQSAAAAPNDGEAWGRLAKAYKAIFFMNKAYRSDDGGAELYQLSVEAYQNCLRLLPEDAEWHAGYAELLANRAYWDMSSRGPTPDTYQALEEMRTALRLAPDDARVQQIAQQISSMFPDAMPRNGTGYDFAWLSTTPTPRPTLPATTAPEPLKPTASSPQEAVPTSRPLSPTCGSAALLPLAIGFWAARKRKP